MKNFSTRTYTFFRNSPTGQTSQQIFAHDGSNDAVLHKDVQFLVLGMAFGDDLSNSVIQIYPGHSLVAMATKLRTKWAITWLLLEISARFLCL